MAYKIETLYTSGWDDAEWTAEQNGAMRPARFRTIDEAQMAIDELIEAVKRAVIAGDMEVEENPNHYRVVGVNDRG